MRQDIDQQSLQSLRLLCTKDFSHPNAFGGKVREGDYQGYSARNKVDGTMMVFLSSKAGDLSIDWLDVSDFRENFMIWATSPDQAKSVLGK